MSSARLPGSACMRRLEFILSGGSYQPPPRITFPVPRSGPFGLRTSPRTKPSANQSATHSAALLARSCIPYGLFARVVAGDSGKASFIRTR
jgi:hypothetical protein